MLWLYRRVVFGALVRDELRDIPDVDRRELLYLVPLVVVVLVMGVWPNLLLEPMHVSVEHLIEQMREARPPAAGLALR